MKFFPDPQSMTERELHDVCRLRRFSEWQTFLQVIGRCRGVVIESLEAQATKPDRDIVLVNIGALAFTGELQEFVEACEEILNQIKR